MLSLFEQKQILVTRHLTLQIKRRSNNLYTMKDLETEEKGNKEGVTVKKVG